MAMSVDLNLGRPQLLKVAISSKSLFICTAPLPLDLIIGAAPVLIGAAPLLSNLLICAAPFHRDTAPLLLNLLVGKPPLIGQPLLHLLLDAKGTNRERALRRRSKRAAGSGGCKSR